jgi:hypothetical protein
VHFENMKHLDEDDINLLLYADVGRDWKHDHLAYRDAVKEFCEDNGFEIISHREKEIGNSESDSYEAEHIFWIHKKKLSEKVRKKLYRKDESINYFDGETRLSQKERKELNRICYKYCGYKEPREIRPLWEELLEHGIDVGVIGGSPNNISPDGGKSWIVSFTKDGCLVTNSKFIYSFYEPSDGLKNDYNIYFS